MIKEQFEKTVNNLPEKYKIMVYKKYEDINYMKQLKICSEEMNDRNEFIKKLEMRGEKYEIQTFQSINYKGANYHFSSGGCYYTIFETKEVIDLLQEIYLELNGVEFIIDDNKINIDYWKNRYNEAGRIHNVQDMETALNKNIFIIKVKKNNKRLRSV